MFCITIDVPRELFQDHTTATTKNTNDTNIYKKNFDTPFVNFVCFVVSPSIRKLNFSTLNP